MNTISIDRNALNSLFDNQKKLDDLFDSIFDEDNFFISNVAVSAQAVYSYPELKIKNTFTYDNNKVIESFCAFKHHPCYYVLPITIELTAIYWLMTYLL